MGITTEQKNGFLFVRFTSDLVSVCDGVTIKWALQQALSNGTRNIVLSVTVGSLSNQRSITRLLRQCRNVVRSGNGNLFFVELNEEEENVYRSICDSMQIPLYTSEDKISPVVSSPVMA
jgi:hypothetical protein